MLLQGQGKVWLSGVSFEAVSTAVPTTVAVGSMKKNPANLNFER
jgi:hypothetical protein